MRGGGGHQAMAETEFMQFVAQSPLDRQPVTEQGTAGTDLQYQRMREIEAYLRA